MEPTLIISGVSALFSAIDTWVNYRDSQRAAREFELRMTPAAQAEPGIRQQALQLAAVVPQPVLDTMGDRARRCWDQYHDVLKDGYLPGEIDDATDAVKKCICRELRRIRDLNGTIPPGDLSTWWQKYCTTS